jgi:PhzF family phenazine biosynthesis protein
MIAYLVDAFTTKRFEGNPAGVVLDADDLSVEDKQKIAAEIHASETAFVSRSEKADVLVEFFTPTTPIDFCGHATIATFFTMATTGRLDLGKDGKLTLKQETKAGVLQIDLHKRDGRIFVTMYQRLPQFAAVAVPTYEITNALNLSEYDLHANYPVGLSNTGNWHLVVPVANRECLNRISYDAPRLSSILQRCNSAVSAHVFAPAESAEPGAQQSLYYARNFCPTVGIPEDPATGAGAGAFGAYLAENKFLKSGDNQFRILQGEAMGRLSQLDVTISTANNEVESIRVSGTAVISFTLTEEHNESRSSGQERTAQPAEAG